MSGSKVSDRAADLPLNIIIVGAGLAGLFASIALKKVGHSVEIYEASRFATETGAAIHLPPNVNGLLRRYGLKAEEDGAVTTEWISEYRPNGELVFSRNVSGLGKAFPYPWQLCHRIDLHNALKKLATEAGVPIHLQSRVAKVDVDTTEITLCDGRVIKGDLIVGADGTHSVIRKYVAGPDTVSQPAGTSAFRFLIPTNVVVSNPVTAHFAEKAGELRLIYASDRRIVVYPCRHNKELNFVCLHPDEDSESPSEDWNAKASKELLLKVFDSYSEDVKALLGLAPPDEIKLWKLLDLPPLSTWTKGKVVLIGDAAHPFLPHQGQGGAQAMEDAAALAALLPLGPETTDLEDCLALYMKARFERATTVQQYTRDSAFKTKRGDHGGKVMDPMQFTSFNFDHDAHDHATGILRRHLAGKVLYKRMPASFGPNPSPRQTLDGKARVSLGLHEAATYQTAYVKFRTKKSYLKTLLPDSNLSIKSEGPWTTATFAVTKLGNLEWLGGRRYSHFGLYIYNVAHDGHVSGDIGTANENAERTGDFLPVLFENMADPIITGRDELGISKVFATLENKLSPPGLLSSGSFDLYAGWEGTEFCHLSIWNLVEIEPALAPSEDPLYHWKVVPSSNESGVADAEYLTVSKISVSDGKKERRWKAGNAQISFSNLAGQEFLSAFPTLANIVDGLRQVEIEQVLESGVRSYP